MSLSSNTLRKLAFVKYLKTLSDDQAKKPSPISSASVLTLHDAIDIFLQEAHTYMKLEKRKGRDGKQINYFLADYASDIHDSLIKRGEDGLNKSFVERINRTRNNLKHATQFVAPVDVQEIMLNAKSFFEEYSLEIFNVNFSEISLIDLIPYEGIRKILEKSLVQKKMGEKENSLNQIYVGDIFG